MSAIPLALSLLSTVAAHYPGLQNAQKSFPIPVSVPVTTATAPPPPPPPPPAAPTTAPQHPPPPPPAPSAPVNIPNVASSNAGTTPSGTPSTSPPVNTSSNLCDNCHLRPKYSDGMKTHPFCSKGCANKMKGNLNGSSNQSTSSGSGNCDFCHNRPKYFDGTRTHPFCSKACARKSSTNSSNTHGGGAGNSNAKTTCQAPGCQKPPFTNTNGSLSDYCSMAHKALGETICLICRQAPKQANSNFCGQTCIDQAEKMGPAIIEVPSGHVTFKSVCDQFKASWRHSGTVCPPVRRVYKILAPQASLAGYNAYRATVEARGQFVAAGRSAGNENRRWHGTRRECNFGDKGQTQFCASSTCSLCCIVRTSFDLSLFGKKTGWGRFGRGIYTSSTSSKSNDYSHNDCQSNLKAILLNKVVVGKGYKMTQDNTSLTAPPAGFDSVLAEKGGSLNYDELVVYTNDAIRPSFLVMYEL